MGKKSDKKARKIKPESIAVRANTASAIPPVQGGRVTVDSFEDVFTSGLRVLTPVSPDETWRNYGLDSKTLSRISTQKLVDLLVDLSPDVSGGVWTFLRLFNPGYEVKAYDPKKTDDKGERVVNDKAQQAIADFLSNLHGPYSVTNVVPANVVINVLALSAFLRGGMFAELILNQAGKLPLEIATPDPATIAFKRIDDPDRGRVWQLGQKRGIFSGGIISPQLITPLDRPTVVYLPVDPLPGKPFGRPLVHPAIFATLFMIGLLHDLRRVIAQQGYPHLDISIDAEKLQALMPSDITGDSAKEKEWFNATFKQIQDTYAALEPDEAWVHQNVATVNMAEGAGSGAKLNGIDKLIDCLERMLARALKTMPLMMGIGTASETTGNRQWEVQAAGIKSLQHLAEDLLERLLTLALQVQGIAADVEFRFSELRAAEMLRDQQVQFLKLRNARLAYDAGLVSQDEQAQMALGKQKADAEQPRTAADNTGGQVASINADPGSERIQKYIRDIPKEDRSAVAQAMLITATIRPNEDEIRESMDWFNEAVPEANRILESESVQ